ncbi:MAG: hypothetical protein FWE18_00350 [Alphaproteobacteria bacterium]|nr:hypothetical protein [Alphaproteobacteria bacterium]
MKKILKLLSAIAVFSAMQISSLFAVCDKAYNDNLSADYEWYLLIDNRTAQQLLNAKVTNAFQFCRVDGRTITVTIDNRADGSSVFGIMDNQEERKTTLTLGSNNVKALLQGEDPRVGYWDSIKLFVDGGKMYVGFLIVPDNEVAKQPLQQN